jgi:hypothetical protein
MQSVRIQLTVDVEMSLEFARLDMSKPCDSHAIVMRKELRGAALPGADVPCSGQKEEAGRVRCCWTPGGVFRVNAPSRTLARSQVTTLPHAKLTRTV